MRLLEEYNKTAVLGFGRLNPPTIGHLKLVDTIKDTASTIGGEPMLYLSHSQDSKKNPLSYEEKVKWCKKAFGDVVKESNARTIVDVIKEVYDNGYTNLVYVGGEDRIGGEEDITNVLLKYNGQPNKSGEVLYNFDSIDFINAGNRNSSSDDLSERASASLARKLAKEGNFEKFKQIVPFDDEGAEELYNTLRKELSENLNEATLKNRETKYFNSVINQILTNHKVPIGEKGDREINLEGFLTPEIESKLKSLLSGDEIDLVSAFNNIMAPAGVRWTNLYKGIYSGYSGDKSAGPGIGAETELKTDKKSKEIINLVEPYLEYKYGDIDNIELVDIEHTGGANSKRGVDFETLFNVSNLYDNVTSGPSTSDKIADVIYKLNVQLKNGKVIEEPIYISVKEGPTVSPINLGLSRTETDVIIDSLTSNITNDERDLLKKVIGLRGTTIPGVTAVDKETGDNIESWYYKFDSNKLDTENFKNAIINSYGNNYYYYHTSKQGKTIQFKPVEEIINKLKAEDVTNADLTVTQSRIVVQFILGDLFCRLFIRRKGSTSLFLLTEVLENRSAYIQFKGTEIKNLNKYDFILK